MHYIYKVSELGGMKKQYERVKEVPLFGVKTGIVCDMLRNEIKDNIINGQKWSIDVSESLRKLGNEKSALVIDFKPNAADGKIHLHQLIKIYGFSNSEWTPLLLYFQGLIVDADRNSEKKENFTVDLDLVKEHDPIFSFTYRLGGIANGLLVGKWTSSGPSAANSALLWPDAFNFFMSNCQQIIREKQRTF